MDLMSSLFSAGSPQAPAPVDTSGAGLTARPPQTEYEEQDGKHTGVAGIGRDILGTLGDFLLTRLHMPAMYAPAQHQRMLDAAWQGHEDDPSAAADRVASIDFAKGQQISQQQNSLDSLKEYRQSSEQRRQASIADANQKMTDREFNRSAGFVQTLIDPATGEFAPDAEARYAAMYPRLSKQYTTQSGYLPSKFDPDALKAYIGGSLGAKAQIQFDQNGQKIDDNYELGDRRATTGENQAQNAANRNVIYGKSVDNTGVHQGNQDKNAEVRTGIMSDNSKETVVRDANAHADRGVSNGIHQQNTDLRDGVTKTVPDPDNPGKSMTIVRLKGQWHRQ